MDLVHSDLLKDYQFPEMKLPKLSKITFQNIHGIKKYMDETIKMTEERGYAETLCGRRKYFPDINNHNKNIKSASERAAINMPIQGTAADMIKLAMINVL